MKTEDVEIFLGLDVGKTDHWACAVIHDGTKIWNKTLPNDEAKLSAVYQKLLAQGQVLVVMDQIATIGALAVAVAQNLGIPVAYLLGISMRRIADMYPGTLKTDEKDAFNIADAPRTMPHTLRSIQVSDEDEATLGVLTGFDLDLARQITQTSNRIGGLFTQIHPPLERVLGPWLEYNAVLEVLAAWPTPAALTHAGKARINAKLKKYSARRHAAWASTIIDALEEQSVIVIGTEAAGLVIPRLARQLISLHAQRVAVATHLEPWWRLTLFTRSWHPCQGLPSGRCDHHRQDLHQRRRTVLLRQVGPDHAPVGTLHLVRTGQPFRQQALETSTVSLSVCIHPF